MASLESDSAEEQRHRDEKADLAKFLTQVEELDTIMKGMNAGDEETRSKAIKKADDILSRKEACPNPINKTVINKDAYKSDPPAAGPDGQVDQDAFMKFVAMDAEDRANRRAERKERATVLKDKGNEAFKEEDFQAAIEYYTQAMEIMKDYSALFTNRAQAYMKIEEYDKAIDDCNFAFRIDEECVKAYITKGRAYLGKKKYDKAIETYEKILEFNPKQDKLVKEYVTAARQAKAAATAEKKVQQLFQEGNEEIKTVSEVLDKLKQKDQPPLYYSGGCRLLTEMLHDDMSRTLFRSHSGFQIILQNDVISKSLKTTGKLQPDQVDMCSVVLSLLATACTENDENQKTIFATAAFTEDFSRLLQKCPHHEIKEATANFVHVFSKSEFGRKMLIENIGSVSILAGLFSFLTRSKTTLRYPVSALDSLAKEKKFIRELYDNFDEKVLPEIEKLMKKHHKMQKSLIPPSLAFIGTLAAETAIRKKLSGSKGFWEGCIGILQSKPNESICTTLLGLMMNVSVETSSALKEMSLAITKETLLHLGNEDADMRERSYGLLSRVIGYDPESQNIACEGHVPENIVKLLPGAELLLQRPALKCLTRLTQSNKTARKAVVQCDKDLKVLVALLSSEDDIIAANTALCIGHCCEDPDVSSSLVGTDIIKQLLAKTDTLNSAIKENCAIAVAKLVTADKRHLERLHDLNGIGILHSCMKYVKP